MGAAYTFNMGGAAILCTLFVTLYGFRTIPPVGSASMDYYDEAVDSTTPTVPVKPANSTKPDITLFSATVVNPRKSRPTPDSDASLPFEPSRSAQQRRFYGTIIWRYNVQFLLQNDSHAGHFGCDCASH